MKQKLRLSFSLFITLMLFACAAPGEPTLWDNTKELYYTYINRTTYISYDAFVELNDAETILATNLIRVGESLTKFEQAFEVLQQPPQAAGLQNLFTQAPWLSGAVLIDAYGTITGSIPEQYPLDLDFTAFIELTEGKNKRDIRVLIQTVSATNVVLVGRPVFDNSGTLLGIFIAYFDIRALLEYSQLDPSIFILAGNTPLWTGDLDIDETPLADFDFAKASSKQVKGTRSNKQGRALWINRYLYKEPLIFAIMQH